MRLGSINRSLGVELAFALFLALSLAVLAAQPWPAFAQGSAAAPAAGVATPAPVSPGVSAKPAPSTPAETGSKPPPGVLDDASAVTLELASHPVAFTSASAEWANGFKSVVGEIAKVDGAVKKAGLTPAGHPFALFLATDDKGFQFEAMVPLAEKPQGKDLTDGVRIGESPSGKAIKFLHRGAYDDIDSTYDLITAFLDEKGVESQNRFVEEYLTDTTEPDDTNLQADIYVFIK
jgi:effector-binding domain-containing protein